MEAKVNMCPEGTDCSGFTNVLQQEAGTVSIMVKSTALVVELLKLLAA